MSNATNLTEVAYNRTADAEGAMKFTVSVVMVYGGAVFGVLILGFFRGLSKNHDEEDRQVNSFLRDIEKTRVRCSRERDLDAVYKTLQHLDIDWKSKDNRNTEGALGRGLAKMIALPVVLSRKNKPGRVKKSPRSSWNRLNIIPRAFSRFRSSNSDPGVRVEFSQGCKTEDGVLVNLQEEREDAPTQCDVDITSGTSLDMDAISESPEQSESGSFQSTSSYLVSFDV
jgi:hypothetical protein